MQRNLLVLLLTAGVTAAGWSQGKADVDEVKTFEVVASRYEFDPATVAVMKGDRVRLRVRSTDRAHGVEIKAFRVKALIPKGGEIVTVEFVADRVGTFEITCSEYCGTGHSAMKGRLLVVAGME